MSPLSDDPLSVRIASLRSRALTVHISISEEPDASPFSEVSPLTHRRTGFESEGPILAVSSARGWPGSKRGAVQMVFFLGRGVPLQTCMTVVWIGFWWPWTEVLVSLLTVGRDCQLEVTQRSSHRFCLSMAAFFPRSVFLDRASLSFSCLSLSLFFFFFGNTF